MDSCAKSERAGAPATVRDLVDQMAAARPRSTFLISPETNRSLSFGGLRAASISIARHLRDLGLHAGDKVAFALDNGLFAAQLLLGSMFGGFVPVPLNVRSGPRQLTYVLDHCDAPILFVAEPYRGLIEEALRTARRSLRVIRDERDALAWSADATPPEDLAGSPLTPGDAALLIYTSGSTGRPKGVVHSHRSVVAGAINAARAHELDASDRSLLVLPMYHINAESVTLFPSLWAGGSVVVPSRFAPRRFWEWMAGCRCTWASLVPTMISQLLELADTSAETPGGGPSEGIRFFRSSSGPLSPAIHRRFVECFGVPLVQAMGLTEAGNVFSNPLPPGVNKRGSVGLPTGSRVRFADSNGVDVERGESGEILVRSPAVMLHYYKDAEATAEAFDADGWLRTGDLARMDEDGYVYIVGRAKELIIKGGVNIAPQEIDNVLTEHPDVVEAAAVGVSDPYLGEDIHAFVVTRPDSAVDESELLDHCEGRLGSFKTPSRIGFVPRLPKGPSGKLQRLKLLDDETGAALDETMCRPQPDHARNRSSGAEQTPIESIIAETWSTLLKVERVEREDDFFALGGYSLLAMQSVSRLRQRIPVVLTLADVLANPTACGLAAVVRARWDRSSRSGGEREGSIVDLEGALLEERSGEDAVTIPRSDRSRRYHLTRAQIPIWYFGQEDPECPLFNECEAVRLRGPLRVDALQRAFDVLVARHEVLRTTIEPGESHPVAVVHDDLPLVLRRVDLRDQPEARLESELTSLLRAEARRPFCLESESGVRVLLIELGAEDHVLSLMMHHVISDRATFGNVWREVAAVYSSVSRGDPVSLPSVACQYGDYALWKAEQAGSEATRAALDFWKKTLDGAPEFLELPADRPRPRWYDNQGAKSHFRISSEFAERLRALSRRESASLFSVLATAFNVLLHQISGRDEIVLGVPVADRGLPELQSMVGYLVNVHPLRTRLRSELAFRELLRRVRKELADLAQHGHVSLSEVVEALRWRLRPEYPPVFQVALNWRDRDAQMAFIGIEGVDVEWMSVDAETAKLDLGFVVTDAGPGDEIWLEVEYRTRLFDRARIERWVEHFFVLLESVVSDAGTTVAELPRPAEGAGSP